MTARDLEVSTLQRRCELESSGIVPSLHHRKGWLRHQKISRSHRNGRSRGGFLFVSIGKPLRLRSQRMLRNIFLIAQPPLAVMQGGDYRLNSNSFTPVTKVSP